MLNKMIAFLSTINNYLFKYIINCNFKQNNYQRIQLIQLKPYFHSFIVRCFLRTRFCAKEYKLLDFHSVTQLNVNLNSKFNSKSIHFLTLLTFLSFNP